MKTPRPLHLDALQAGVVRKLAQHACADLCEPALLRRSDDMLARARVIHAALCTRRRFTALYERSRELQAALERFKATHADPRHMNAHMAEDGVSGAVAFAVLVVCCAMMATLLGLAST
jgi:hypothetical protein